MTQHLPCRQSDPETKGPGHEGPLSSVRRPRPGRVEVTFRVFRTGHAGLHGCQRRGRLDLHGIGRLTIGDHRPALPWPGMGPGRTGPDSRLSVQSVRWTVRSGGHGGALDADRVRQALTKARVGTLTPPQSIAAVSCRGRSCTGTIILRRNPVHAGSAHRPRHTAPPEMRGGGRRPSLIWCEMGQ